MTTFLSKPTLALSFIKISNKNLISNQFNRLSSFIKRSNKAFLCGNKKNYEKPDSQEHIGWIKALFKDQTPNTFFTHPEHLAEDIKSPIDIPGCLINDVENTLAIPLIDFNPDVVVNQLIQISRVKPDNRKKPIGATVKGQGGGKTRAFEEVRRRLLVRDKVLVIGITFNSKWTYEKSLDNWSKVAEENPRLSYALSIISRMASVVFDKDFEETVNFMKKQIDSLPEYYRIKPVVLLRHFSSYLVDRVSAYREIDTFIVLVDEVMRLENELKKKFPQDCDGDVTSVLRTALLDEYISIDKNINSALAISSLSNAPIGVSPTGRALTVLLIPDSLNSADIVNKIFGLSECSEEEKLLMENIAVTVNTIPRLVEFMREYITEQKSLQKRDLLLIDNLFVRNLIDNCVEQIDSRYKTEKIVNDKILSAIVYGDDLELNDKDTLDAISRSVISNSLTSLNNEEDQTPKVQTSTLMLWKTTKSKKYDEDSLGKFIHRGISETIEKVTNFKKKGDLLETFLFEWMKIRIVAAISYNQSSLFTLNRLLGFNIELIPEKYKKIFDTPIEIFKKSRNDFVVDILGSSRDNMNEMYSKLMNVEVSESKPIVLVRLIKDGPKGKEEAFDLVLVVRNPEDSKVPFIIFFDAKSREEGLQYQNRPLIKVNDILDKRDQYNQTKTMMRLNNGSRDFMYIYFRTHNVKSRFIAGENNIVIELGRNETEKFFGPSFFNLYVTLRNSMRTGSK